MIRDLKFTTPCRCQGLSLTDELKNCQISCGTTDTHPLSAVLDQDAPRSHEREMEMTPVASLGRGPLLE